MNRRILPRPINGSASVTGVAGTEVEYTYDQYVDPVVRLALEAAGTAQEEVARLECQYFGACR